MIGYETLSAAIVTKVGSSSLVKASEVYDYAKAGVAGFPAVTVTPFDGVPQIADTVRNQRVFVFSIKVMVNRQGKEQAAEDMARRTIDDLIQIFDADRLLGSTLMGVGFCKPIPSKWGYNQAESVNVRIAELLLEVVTAQ